MVDPDMELALSPSCPLQDARDVQSAADGMAAAEPVDVKQERGQSGVQPLSVEPAADEEAVAKSDGCLGRCLAALRAPRARTLGFWKSRKTTVIIIIAICFLCFALGCGYVVETCWEEFAQSGPDERRLMEKSQRSRHGDECLFMSTGKSTGTSNQVYRSTKTIKSELAVNTKKAKPMFFFDWDETLFPSKYMKGLEELIKEFLVKNKELDPKKKVPKEKVLERLEDPQNFKPLDKLGQIARHAAEILQVALKIDGAEVVIITNAKPGWLEKCVEYFRELCGKDKSCQDIWKVWRRFALPGRHSSEMKLGQGGPITVRFALEEYKHLKFPLAKHGVFDSEVSKFEKKGVRRVFSVGDKLEDHLAYLVAADSFFPGGAPEMKLVKLPEHLEDPEHPESAKYLDKFSKQLEQVLRFEEEFVQAPDVSQDDVGIFGLDATLVPETAKEPVKDFTVDVSWKDPRSWESWSRVVITSTEGAVISKMPASDQLASLSLRRLLRIFGVTEEASESVHAWIQGKFGLNLKAALRFAMTVLTTTRAADLKQFVDADFVPGTPEWGMTTVPAVEEMRFEKAFEMMSLSFVHPKSTWVCLPARDPSENHVAWAQKCIASADSAASAWKEHYAAPLAGP